MKKTSALLMLVLLFSSTLCQAQQTNWWDNNLYSGWSRVYQLGSVNNQIVINNYAFFFTTEQIFVGRPLPQIPVTTQNNQPNIPTTVTGIDGESGLAPYSFWWEQFNAKLDGENYNQWYESGFDGELGLILTTDGEARESPFDGEQTLSVYDGEWPIINPLTETATAYGLDGEVFVIEGNTVQQKAASDAFLDYRLALIAYSNRLARVSDGESGQTLFIRVQLYTVDRAVDYVDPLKTNEAFEIFISPNGDTVFRVAGYVAFLRALETFSQLIAPGGVLTRLPIYIADFPSYSWRSLLLDVSTRYIEIDEIKRLINGMQISKLNVLSLSITDTESFPYELVQFPEVTKQGAFSSEQVYTRESLVDLIQYAQARGVVVVPELEQPVHTHSWTEWEVFKEVNACGDIDPKQWPKYCYQPPCGQIDPTNNLAYLLVYSVFAEVQTIFPSRYVHLGADLFTASCYDQKPSIKDWMQQNNITNYFDLYDYYMNNVRQHIGPDHHRIYWLIEEFKNLTFWDKDILQYWESAQNLTILDDIQNPIILSQWDELYINCGTGSFLGSNNWCNPFKTWYDFYHFSIPTGEAAQRVLGAAATIWTDVIDEYNLDSLVFPRASALGLRLWNSDQTFTRDDLARKLVFINQQLRQWDIYPTPVTNEYCEYHIDECFSKTVLQLLGDY